MNADFSYEEETELITFGKIIVDAQVIDHITDQEIGQMIHYLKVTGLPVGLILNFKNPKLEFRRVVARTQNFIRKNNSRSLFDSRSPESICG